MSHHHEEVFNKDKIRQTTLESYGITFLRFSEADVKYDMFNVLRTIETGIIELVRHNKDIRLPKGFDISLPNG